MTGIDVLTRDWADTENGTAIVTHAYARWGKDVPVSHLARPPPGSAPARHH